MAEKECDFKNNEKCDIFDSYENLSPSKKLELVITIFQKKWLKWTMIGIFGSLGIIFTLGIFNYYLSNFNKSLDFKIFGALQIWVGFALGIIATLFSIISMFLSFYNLELQKDSEEKNKIFLNSIKESIVTEIKNEVTLQLKEIKNHMTGHFETLENKSNEISLSIKNSPNDSINNCEKTEIKKGLYEEMLNKGDK